MRNFIKPVLHAWKFSTCPWFVSSFSFSNQFYVYEKREPLIESVKERQLSISCLEAIKLNSIKSTKKRWRVYIKDHPHIFSRSYELIIIVLCLWLLTISMTLFHNKFEFERLIIELESLQYGNVHRIKRHLQLQRLMTSYGPTIDLHNLSGSIDVLIFHSQNITIQRNYKIIL